MSKTYIEEVLVISLSIHFLLVSTLNLQAVREAVGLRFIETFFITMPLAFLLALAIGGAIRAQDLEPKLKSVNAKTDRNLDLLVCSIVILSAFLLLFKKILETGDSVTFDEPIHLKITEDVSTFDFGILQGFARYVNPPLPYFLFALLLKPVGISLLNCRLLSSVIASIIPAILYLLAIEFIKSRRAVVALSYGYILTPLYQNVMYRLTFDGLSTMIFISSVYFFFKAIKTERVRHSAISAVFLGLCILTKYPPAIWLILGYASTILFLKLQGEFNLKQFMPIIVGIAIPSAILPILLPRHLQFLLQILLSVPASWPLMINEYKTLLWDLLLLLGWSPYLISIFMLRDFRQTRERDPVDLLSLTLIALAFAAPLLNPLTRRIVQIIPIFFITTISYSMRRYRTITLILIWLNLFWWGLINLPA